MTTDLSSHIVLLTGGRIQIGYHIALKVDVDDDDDDVAVVVVLLLMMMF